MVISPNRHYQWRGYCDACRRKSTVALRDLDDVTADGLEYCEMHFGVWVCDPQRLDHKFGYVFRGVSKDIPAVLNLDKVQ